MATICRAAGVTEDFDEPMEKDITKAFSRLASIDSRRLLTFILNELDSFESINFESYSPGQRRMLQMFYASVWTDVIDFDVPQKAYDNLRVLARSKTLLGEMKGLLKYRFELIDFVDSRLDFDFDCPLDLHCTYSRDQIMLALDFMKPSTVREGVKWLPDKKIDVLFVTLNKSDKDYSPTTMYKDYSINETLFHWQSQSTTSDTSPTGQRYIEHRKQGSKVLLCVRDSKKDAWGNTAPYSVLGFVDYVQHSGSRPMNIVWRLADEIPAKYIKQTRKMLVS